MRHAYLWMLLLLMQAVAEAQDFSNKGKDFWLCFPSHVPNEKDGITYYAKMSLFITSDKNSTGTVSIPGIFNMTFSVNAGQVTEIDVPYNLAHINPAQAASVIRKGIRVKVDAGKPPVVVYSHIYAGYRSAASLILPTAVLGKKYYSMNAPQVSINGSKSQFVIVAVDSNTTVLITPVRDGVKGTPITVQLPLPGDLYELQDNLDLSGSLIESVSPNTESCKPIAVFSGSSAIHIVTNNLCTPGDSYDPLYQQLYPVNAWGKSYGFIPFQGYVSGNPYRIIASEDNTTVTVNGLPVATLNAGQYYPTKASFGQVETRSLFINADKPVSVAQYAQSSSCSGNPVPTGSGYGDPDMVLLNPIEQNVNDITIFSSQKENIYADAKFINVLIKQNAAASFTINGVAPAATWQPMLPTGSGYAYAKIPLPANLNACTLNADSAFNVIAYGFGNFESYAYSAGTNVKDLYRTLTVENEFGKGTIPVGCNNSTFHISVTYPYQPLSISFNFYGLFPDKTINSPVPVASFMQNGKLVYRYRLTDDLLVNQAGSYPITVTATNSSNNTGCNNGQDEIDYELTIVERPKAGFTVTHSGCITDAVQFTDVAAGGSNPLTAWYWDFGDGNTSALQSPATTYAAVNDYTVKHRAISDIGCGSDTAIKVIAVTNVPVADFHIQHPTVCTGTALQYSDATTFPGNGSLVLWVWDFGDQQQLTATNATAQLHTYQSAGNYTTTLYVQTNSGCKSAPVQHAVVVQPSPHASFKAPVFCLPNGTGQFINESTISNNSTLASQWDFGDGGASVVASPVHRYTSAGPFNVKLTVSSADGCADDSIMLLNTVYPQAPLQLTATPENCLGDSSLITIAVQSNGYAGLNAIYWNENGAPFNDTIPDGSLNRVRLPVLFNTSGNQLVSVYATTPVGCNTDTVTITIHINKLPTADFATSSPLCEQQAVHFTDLSVANEGVLKKWAWDFGNGSQSNYQHPDQAFATGNWPVTLWVETDKGCHAASVVHPLVVSPVPVAAFEAPVSCAADPFVPFTNESTIADGSGNSLVYQWNFGDKNASAANPGTSNQKDPRHTYSVAGNYPVTLQVTSNNGCAADTTQTVMVNGAIVTASFTSQAFPAICNNQPVLLQDASTVNAGEIIRREIYWNYDNDPLQKTTDDTSHASISYNFQYPTSATDKVYHIKYVVYSGITCMQQLDSQLVVKQAPLVQFDPLKDVCQDAPSFAVNIAKEVTGVTGAGHYEGAGVSAAGIFSPTKAGVGQHTIVYSFTADNGCMDTAQQSITVIPSPVVYAGADKKVSYGSTIQLEGEGKGDNIQFEWSPTTFMDDAHIAQPMVTPTTDITYTLTVRSGEGCAASDAVTLQVIDKIHVPNAFTPNNDGRNDTWKIPDLELFDNCTVRVFNRWGQQVFSSKGYSRAWDGSFNGQELPAGAYTYIISYKNGWPLMSGVVMLIR